MALYHNRKKDVNMVSTLKKRLITVGLWANCINIIDYIYLNIYIYYSADGY